MKKVVQFVAVLAVLLVTVLTNATANAQSTGLGINPRKDLTVEPGKTVSDQLYISNLNSKVNTRVTLNIIDFKANGETGTPALQLDANAPQTPWSLKPFIKAPKTVELKAGESKYVPFSVTIPTGQGAGSYYSAIKFDPSPDDGSGDNTVVLSGAPAQLVFVTVPGRATELMNLKEFSGYVLDDKKDAGKYKSLYVSTKPTRFAYLLENIGNVAESPAGSIVVKNIFGREVKVIKDANPKDSLALIGQTRRFDVCIDSQIKEVRTNGQTSKQEVCNTPKLLPGMYKAQLNVFYGINGSNSQEINATATIWYMPLWFVGAILVFLAVLAYVIVKVRNSLVGTKVHRRGNTSGGRKFPFKFRR
jgi:hypothetical protein